MTNRCETSALKTTVSTRVCSPAMQQLFADAANWPRHKNGLIIGCHGKAWVPASNGDSLLRSPPNISGPRFRAPTNAFVRRFEYELNITEFVAALRSLAHKTT